MEIHLTPQQQLALDSKSRDPARIVDPRNRAVYVLIRECDYESIRELFEEEQQRQIIHAVALRNAAGRMDEAP
jgi:hypothetical protein